jgi:hypothetical protein
VDYLNNPQYKCIFYRKQGERRKSGKSLLALLGRDVGTVGFAAGRLQSEKAGKRGGKEAIKLKAESSKVKRLNAF